MKTENIERYMNSFGRQVVAQAKTTLNYKKGGDSKLEDSIKFKVIEDKEGFTLQFFMSSYGQYVDIKRKTLTFLVARKIGRYGIQGISFFQKPLGLALEQFGKDLLGNVKEDIINSITTIK